MGWYLCYFLHRHLDFRREELQALADMAGCGGEIKWREPHGGVDHSPFWKVYIPTEALAVEICRRSILTRALIEVWGEGDSQEELNASVKAFPDANKAPYIAENTTFKVCVEDFGKTEHGTEKNPWSHVVARIDALKPVLEFKGRARMKGAGTHLLVRRIRTSKRTQRSPFRYTAADVLWQSRRVRGPFAPEQIRTT